MPTATQTSSASQQTQKDAAQVSELRELKPVADYFAKNANEWSGLYSEIKRANHQVLLERKAFAVGYLKHYLPKGSRILDAGCGGGLASLDLVRAGFKIHGVDIADDLLNKARRTFEAEKIEKQLYEFTDGAVDTSTLEPGSYDGIVALGFLQYQPDEAASLNELWKLLKPGGILVISGPTKMKFANYFGLTKLYYTVEKSLKKLRTKKNGGGGGAGGPVISQISRHRYGRMKMRKLIKEAGFKMLEEQGYGYVDFAGLENAMSLETQLKVHHGFSKVAKVLPIDYFANDLIVAARKVQK